MYASPVLEIYNITDQSQRLHIAVPSCFLVSTCPMSDPLPRLAVKVEADKEQYNDIRQGQGSKSIMISNRLDGTPMAGDSLAVKLCEEKPGTFSKHKRHAYYLWVVFHELFGHGTGKLLQENADSTYNFDLEKLPFSPVTGEPIDSWYRPGETWTGVFQDIATSVDECRAECIGAYLMS